MIKASRAFIAVLVFCATAAFAVSSSADTTETVHFQDPVNDSVEDGRYFVNEAKAGSAIPLKFSLGGYQGLEIFAAEPHVEDITAACDGMASGAEGSITQLATTVGQGLSYDAGSDTYTYVWKAPSRTETLQNRCWQLILTFTDGREARANFRFF